MSLTFAEDRPSPVVLAEERTDDRIEEREEAGRPQDVDAVQQLRIVVFAHVYNLESKQNIQFSSDYVIVFFYSLSVLCLSPSVKTRVRVITSEPESESES